MTGDEYYYYRENLTIAPRGRPGAGPWSGVSRAPYQMHNGSSFKRLRRRGPTPPATGGVAV